MYKKLRFCCPLPCVRRKRKFRRSPSDANDMCHFYTKKCHYGANFALCFFDGLWCLCQDSCLVRKFAECAVQKETE